MLANLPAILKHLSKEHKAAAAGQGGLFEAPALEQLKLVELPDWSEHERLWHERKALGGFVSGHPLNRYRDKVAGRVTHRCHEHADIMASGSGVRLVVAGLVHDFRRFPRISYMTLGDGTGTLEIIAFNDEADRFAHCLMRDAIIACKVKARHDANRSSLQLVDAFRLGHFRAPK